jgi:hypothetical protein
MCHPLTLRKPNLNVVFTFFRAVYFFYLKRIYEFLLFKTEISGRTDRTVHNTKSPFKWIALNDPLDISLVILFFSYQIIWETKITEFQYEGATYFKHDSLQINGRPWHSEGNFHNNVLWICSYEVLSTAAQLLLTFDGVQYIRMRANVTK